MCDVFVHMYIYLCLVVFCFVFCETTVEDVPTTLFFKARLMKFMLVVGNDVDKVIFDVCVEKFHVVAHRIDDGLAVFGFARRSKIRNLEDFFEITSSQSASVLVAYDPANDHRFRSVDVFGTMDEKFLQNFMSGVKNGTVRKLVQTENYADKKWEKRRVLPSYVVRTNGSDVVRLVRDDTRDVMLFVYYPGHPLMRGEVMPEIELIARAVHREPRLLVARIDGTVNELPHVWKVTGPTILWFSVNKKTNEVTFPMPRIYWDSDFSVPEIMRFIKEYSSFDVNSLQVGTMEQIQQLYTDLPGHQNEFLDEIWWTYRNYFREIGTSEWEDYFFGEVVFDGSRIHMIVLRVFFWGDILLGYVLMRLIFKKKLTGNGTSVLIGTSVIPSSPLSTSTTSNSNRSKHNKVQK